MKYFYDTEFLERGPGFGIDAISIGMVAADGGEFYAEFADAPWGPIHAHPWLSAHVVPHLDARFSMVRSELRAQLVRFWELHGWPTELWAYYSAYDHVVLAQIFGAMVDLPTGVPMHSRDLKAELERLGLKRPPIAEPEMEHHALADARWCRLLHRALDL